MDFVEMLLEFQKDIGADSVSHDAVYPPEIPHLSYALTLAAMAAHSTGPIVEVGTDGGLGTMSLAYGATYSGHPVHTFEIRDDRRLSAMARLARFGFNGIHYHLGNCDLMRSDVLRNGETVGFSFIDGGHDFKNCLHDIENLTAIANRTTRILLHDYFGGREERDHNGVHAAVMFFLKHNPCWIGIPFTTYSGFFMLSMSEDMG